MVNAMSQGTIISPWLVELCAGLEGALRSLNDDEVPPEKSPPSLDRKRSISENEILT